MNGVLRILATGLGTGFSPFAPGTAGSILAIVIYALVPGFAPPPDAAGIPNLATIFAIVLTAAIAVPAASEAEREFGHDAGPIVIDEVVGQWITVAGLAATPLVLVAGLFFFRVFDVFKPFPARRFEQLHGGLGMMADDLMVAIYGNLLLRAAVAVLPGLFFV